MITPTQEEEIRKAWNKFNKDSKHSRSRWAKQIKLTYDFVPYFRNEYIVEKGWKE